MILVCKIFISSRSTSANASLKFANIASRLLANVIVRFSQPTLGKPKAPPSFNIQLDCANAPTFFSKRYAKDYQVVKDGYGHYVYKIYIENGAAVAYLIDVQPLNRLGLNGQWQANFSPGNRLTLSFCW